MPKVCANFVAIPLLLLAFAGCRKEKKITATYDFSFSGSPYIGNTIHFTVSPPSGSKFAWDFGDKNTAAVANPDHIYSVAGSYDVALMVNDDTTHIIRKTVKVGFDSTLMSALAGSRLYHHDKYSTAYFVGGPTVSHETFADATVSITIIDPATISFGSDTLYFSSYSSGTMFFSYSNSTPGPNSLNSKTLNFYTGTDSIYYVYNVHESAASSSAEIYSSL